MFKHTVTSNGQVWLSGGYDKSKCILQRSVGGNTDQHNFIQILQMFLIIFCFLKADVNILKQIEIALNYVFH